MRSIYWTAGVAQPAVSTASDSVQDKTFDGANGVSLSGVFPLRRTFLQKGVHSLLLIFAFKQLDKTLPLEQ